MESACSMKGPVIDWPSNPSELVRGVNDSWNSYQRAQKGRTVTTAEWKAERETLWQEYEKCMALPPTSTNLPACNASAAGAVDEAVEAETSPCSSSSSAVSKRTKMSSTRGEESYALQAGTKVIGYFCGLKQETGWYGATIADVLVDNDTDGADRIRYRVDWDDGDTRDTHKTSDDIAIVMADLLLNPSLAHLRALPRMSPAIIADLESGLDPGKIVWAGRGKGCWPGRIAWLERAPPQVLLEQKPGMILVHYFDGWADSTRDVQNTPSLWTYSWLKPAQIRDFEGTFDFCNRYARRRIAGINSNHTRAHNRQLPGAFYFEDGANVPGTCRPCPDAVSSLQASRLGQQVSCDIWGCGSEDDEEDQPKKADVSTG